MFKQLAKQTLMHIGLGIWYALVVIVGGWVVTFSFILTTAYVLDHYVVQQHAIVTGADWAIVLWHITFYVVAALAVAAELGMKIYSRAKLEHGRGS